MAPVSERRRDRPGIFKRSLEHFVTDYAALADRWFVWDARELPAILLTNSNDERNGDLRKLLSK